MYVVARMVESVDTQDLKSCGHCGCVGSSPTPGTKASNRTNKILEEIQSGQFVKEFMAENKSGKKNFDELRAKGKKHQIEEVGEKLRSMMPWISAGKQKVSEASGG